MDEKQKLREELENILDPIMSGGAKRPDIDKCIDIIALKIEALEEFILELQESFPYEDMDLS